MFSLNTPYKQKPEKENYSGAQQTFIINSNLHFASYLICFQLFHVSIIFDYVL